MKKIIKWVLGLGIIGTAAGLLTVQLIKKSKNITSSDAPDDITDNEQEETDSDSFDLDQDLEPAQERSYVSLHVSESETETVSEDTETKNE